MNKLHFANPIFDEQCGIYKSGEIDDHYHSDAGGQQEAEHVFVNNSGWIERWQHWQGECCIVETGFGAGFNVLTTWRAFALNAPKSAHLHIISIENRPLKANVIRAIFEHYPELAPYCDLLLEQYQYLHAGVNHFFWRDQRVKITLMIDELSHALTQLSAPVHGWYLDGFSPSKNDSMWSDQLFTYIGRLSQQTLKQDTRTWHDPITAVSYTVSGKVRRGLKSAGFKVMRKDSCGNKRHMLNATYQQTQGPEQPYYVHQKPWLIAPGQSSSHDSVVVIGAGLAGAQCARALAERGKKVTVIDSKGIAQGASGNPRGALYVKLAATCVSSHTDFYVQGLQHSLQTLAQIAPQGSWQRCGVMQYAFDDTELKRQQKVIDSGLYSEHLLEARSPALASGQMSGVWMAHAGWVDPQALCQALLDHPSITFEHGEVLSMDSPDHGVSGWALSVSDKHGHIRRQHAPILVIANAYRAQELLAPLMPIGTRKIRGQISYLPKDRLRTQAVLCAKGYAIEGDSASYIGATYNLNDDNEALTLKDHQENLAHAHDLFPNASLSEEDIIGGRVSFRCTSPDYLPLAGRLIDARACEKQFAGLKSNAKRWPKQTMPWLNNAYASIAHGSRGLASTSLCAELISAHICNETPCVSLDIENALFPGRFVLRALAKARKTD